jgi:hypothetical protein
MSILMLHRAPAASAGGGDPPVEGSNLERITSAFGAHTIPARFAYDYASETPAIEIPDDPVVSATSNCSNNTDITNALAASNGRTINIAAGTYSSLTVGSGKSDLDIVVDNGATFSGALVVQEGATRIRVTGGNFFKLFILDDATNVLIDNIRFAATGADELGISISDFGGITSKIAVINCTSSADGGYGILYRCHHMIIANCSITTTAADVGACRGTGQNIMFVGNQLVTGGHRVIRLHNDSSEDTDLVLFSGNQLEGPDNVWIGWVTGSTPLNIDRVSFIDNSYYGETGGTNGVFQTDADITPMDDWVVTGNDFYSPDNTIDTAGITNLTISGNTSNAYTTPPAYSGGADH